MFSYMFLNRLIKRSLKDFFIILIFALYTNVKYNYIYSYDFEIISPVKYKVMIKQK